ncbi:hypothetical protein [Colwellia sp. MB02u-9]|uniref:hypothetical protein n=1 Tax=Colwellia sp. MB02u-9 TaxID=2759823 RepID=UPI0015F6F756|nr:hypothetical protein [Colwellia sp. MB02u-9]MBA6294620.1 hypothetical protein [Colwellia sp. MB02u-9]
MKIIIISIVCALTMISGCASILKTNLKLDDTYYADIWSNEDDDFWYENYNYQRVINSNERLFVRAKKDLDFFNELPGQSNFSENVMYAVTTTYEPINYQQSSSQYKVTRVLTKTDLDAIQSAIDLDKEQKNQLVMELQQQAEKQKRKEKEAAEIAKIAEEKAKNAQKEKALVEVKSWRKNNLANANFINAVWFLKYPKNTNYVTDKSDWTKAKYSTDDCVYADWFGSSLREIDFNRVNWKSQKVDGNAWSAGDYAGYNTYITVECVGKCDNGSNKMQFNTEDISRTQRALRDIKEMCPGVDLPY